MADYIPAVIAIGGEVTSRGARSLLGAIASDGATSSHGGSIADEADLEAWVSGKEPLVLAHSDAPFGTLPGIEAACREIGLTFRRCSDARYEYEAEIVSWTPGMTEPRWTQGSQDGTPVVPLAQVTRIVNDSTMSDADIVTNLRSLVSEAMPISVPPLVLSSRGEHRSRQ